MPSLHPAYDANPIWHSGFTYDRVLAIQRLIVAVPAHMIVPAAVLVEEAGVEGSPSGLLH